MIRVLLADDNAVIRRGVASLLSDTDDFEVVGEAGDGREAIRLGRELRPDVALLDIRMPVLDGIAAAEALSPICKVMMLTYGEEEAQVTRAIRAGASGYLVHGRFEPEELEQRVRQLAAGESVMSPAVAAVVFDALRRAPGGSHAAAVDEGPDPLTSREREVMNLIAQGLTNAQISERFFLSEKTVKNHVNRIYGKLGASNRAQATALWLGTAPEGG